VCGAALGSLTRGRSMKHASALQAILANDPARCRVLAMVRSLGLPDCWIGAGFIRNAVWDYLHDRPPGRHAGDVDVIWLSPERAGPSEDEGLEAALRALDPSVDWSVKNQARMHLRNGDAPYASAVEAIGHWPETATAVAARQTAEGAYEIAAPFGLGDLFDLVLRPTPRFAAGDKRAVYLDSIQSKRWLAIWPRLRIAP
jgi:uncharacterized protein